MRAAALLAGAAALAACASVGRPGDDLRPDQLQIIEAVASDISGDLCVRPLLRGRLGEYSVWSHMPPHGFRDLSEDSGRHRDVRIARERIGRVRIADEADCFTMLVPRVDDDRGLTAIFLAADFLEFGLRRENGRWRKVAQGGPSY